MLKELRTAISNAADYVAGVLDPQRPVQQRQLTEAEKMIGVFAENGNIRTGKTLEMGKWGRIFSANPPTATGWVFRCHCGTNYPYTGATIDDLVSETDDRCTNRSCAAKHGPFDFARDTWIRLDSVAADSPDILKIVHGFSGEITAEDYHQEKDGKFWINNAKREKLLSIHPLVPDTTIISNRDSGPMIIPTAGPEPEVAWAGSRISIGNESDPASAGPGFRNAEESTERRDAKHEARVKRHNSSYGPEKRLANLREALLSIPNLADRDALMRSVLADNTASENRIIQRIAGGVERRGVAITPPIDVTNLHDAIIAFKNGVTEEDARKLLARVEKREL